MMPMTNKHATLPNEIEERTPTIAKMDFGRTYYTVPWAMWADRDRLLWLHPDYSVSDAPKGTSAMRLELHEDGYHVWPPPGRSWKTQDAAGYVGNPSQSFIPVAELHSTGQR